MSHIPMDRVSLDIVQQYKKLHLTSYFTSYSNFYSHVVKCWILHKWAPFGKKQNSLLSESELQGYVCLTFDVIIAHL